MRVIWMANSFIVISLGIVLLTQSEWFLGIGFVAFGLVGIIPTIKDMFIKYEPKIKEGGK